MADNKRQNSFVLTVIKLCSVLLVIALVLLTGNNNVGKTPDRFFSNRESTNSDIKVSEIVSPIILQDTKIYYHDFYDSCQHDYVYERPQGSAGLVSLNKYQLEALFPTYVIEEFSAEKVSMRRYLDDRCFECEKYAFIGEKDGYVAIFYGKARENAELKTITDIPMDKFTLNQQQIIRAGITVQNSDEEINAILEGLDR